MLASRFGDSTTIVLTSAALNEDGSESAKSTVMCDSLLAHCAHAMDHPDVMISRGCTYSAVSTMHKHNIQVMGVVGEGKEEEHGPPFRSKLHVCAPRAHVYL